MHKTSTLFLSTSETPANDKARMSAVAQQNGADLPEVSDSVVNAILNYSRSLSVTHSASVGFIEVVAS